MMDGLKLAQEISGLAIGENLISFLRQELRRYRFTQIADGKKLPVAALAGQIQASDETLKLSAETLRRFLNDDPQEPEHSRVRAIAKFLIEEDWLTLDELRGMGRDIDVRGAVALADLMGVRRTKASAEFCRSLTGRYRQCVFAADRLRVREWTISYAENSGVLSVSEVARQFELDETKGTHARMRSGGIQIAHVVGFENMPGAKTQVGAMISSSGIAVADDQTMLVILSDARTLQGRLYGVEAIGFDDTDAVLALGGTLYPGWAVITPPNNMSDTAALRAPNSSRLPRPESPALTLFNLGEGHEWYDNPSTTKTQKKPRLQPPKKKTPENKSMRIIK